jgi:hypothetical protein
MGISNESPRPQPPTSRKCHRVLHLKMTYTEFCGRNYICPRRSQIDSEHAIRIFVLLLIRSSTVIPCGLPLPEPGQGKRSMQHATRLTQPRRMLQRSRDKTAQRVVQTSDTSGSAYRKKISNFGNLKKKYLQCVLAARILTVDSVVCTLATKKKSGQVSTCRIGPFPCESCYNRL